MGELSERVETLEGQVSRLAGLMANHVASLPVLLVGWAGNRGVLPEETAHFIPLC